MTRRTLLQKLGAWSRFIPMFIALKIAEQRSLGKPVRRMLGQWGTGVSVLIPESGTPELLGKTLAHATRAVAVLAEPAEIIVQVNGANASVYRDLQRDYPAVIWRFSEAATDCPAAPRSISTSSVWRLIESGDWVYCHQPSAMSAPVRTSSTRAIRSGRFMIEVAERVSIIRPHEYPAPRSGVRARLQPLARHLEHGGGSAIRHRSRWRCVHG